MITTEMSVTTGELPSAGGPSATRIIQTPETVIVLAGASLDTSQLPHDGWYTEALGKHLAAGLAATPSIDLRTALQQAIATLARQHHLVAGADPAATVSIVHRSSDEILIATPGVGAAVEKYPVFTSWTELAAVCRDRGPGHAVRMVHEAERADPTGVRWPREEPHSDNALAVVTFTRPA